MEDFTKFICFEMRTAMKRLDKYLTAKMEKYGITIPQSFVLFCLLEEDGCTLKEIGNRAQIDSSSMTVLVDKLENEGLVERRLDSQDRRAIRVYLTPKGRDLAEEVLSCGTEFNDYLLARLGGSEKEFRAGLAKIMAAAE